MKRSIINIIGVILIGSASFVQAKMPDNITCTKRAVVAYYESGEFNKDVNKVVQDAESYLFQRVNENNRQLHKEKLAMVLDIDDTSLSNFVGNKKRDFSGTKDAINASYRDADAPAVSPVLRLYNEAIRDGVEVFFISFRPDEFRSYTITNLQKSGYYGWSAMYLPDSTQIQGPAQSFKTAIRKALTAQGYTIILNLGDQDSDLNGGFAEHTDKIPNPLYTTSPQCAAHTCSI